MYESTKELLCVQMTFHPMQDVVQSLNFASIISGENYAIRTADGKQIVTVKGFTLNYVASNQLNFDVMKDMAISDEQHSVKIVGTSQIKKDLKRRQINTLPSSKSYKRIFNKRVRNTKNHTSLPFGFA